MGLFPDQLTARVVTPGAQPRIHGYDVESDLARHYSPSAVAFLAVTGELPSPEVAAALDTILVFASPVSVAHAPTHAAVLAQLCGAPSTSILSVAAIGLSEQIKHTLDEHEGLLQWLQATSEPLPERFRAATVEEAENVERLRGALYTCGFLPSVLSQSLSLQSAIFAALHACGLTTRRSLEMLLVWARLPVVMAEAFAESVANFKNYPTNLPRFVYEESTS
jgi:hypothetical protein